MIGVSKLTADKYCAKVMHVIFDEIPEFVAFRGNFVWNDISLIFRRNCAMPIASIHVIFWTIIHSSQKFVANLRMLIHSPKMHCKFSSGNSLFPKIHCKFLSIHSLCLSLATALEKFDWLHVGEYSLCKASITTAEFCFITWVSCSTKLTCLLSN